MASRTSNSTGRWWARALRTAGLGSFVVQLALFCGAMNAAGQPAVTKYADLPELSGPFSELKDAPESLKEISVLRTSGGDLVILPTTLRLYPDDGGFRLEHNALSAAGVTPGPLAQLELFVQPTVNDLASIMIAASKVYPLVKVGRPKITRAITAEFIINGIFGQRHKETILKLGSDFSVSDIVFVTFEPTHLFMRMPFNGDIDALAVRVSYEIPFQGADRQFQIGMSFSPDCRTSPKSFLDLMNSTYGCPDRESWKLASPNLLEELLSACASDVPSSIPEAILNRWKERKRKDCAIALFSHRRPG